MFEGICEAIHNELDTLEEKYSNGAKMNNADLELIDRMSHALKSLATYDAMKNYDSRERSRDAGRYDRRTTGWQDGYRRY